MKPLTYALVGAAMLASTGALAQNAGGAIGGAAGGAAVGTVVGGPVGTAIGAGIGAIVGSTLPAHPSRHWDRPLVVGQPLPGDFEYYPVPHYDRYVYTIVDGHRVIVDRADHVIVRVID
jgi:hypothetical protein